jgi:hypothetical protein
MNHMRHELAGDIDRLFRVLGAYVYAVANEAELQLQVSRALDRASIQYEREVRLGPGERVDFMVRPGIALELKTQTDPVALLRQVLRYAAHPDVRYIVIGTTSHRGLGLPSLALGKPLRSIHLAAGL